MGPSEGHSLTGSGEANESVGRLSHTGHPEGHHWGHRRGQRVGSGGTSAGVEETALEVVVDVFLAHPEGATDAYGGELPVVHESVDRHLGNAHYRGHFGNGQELHLGDVVRGHGAPLSLSHVPRHHRRKPHVRTGRNIGPNVTYVLEIPQSD